CQKPAAVPFPERSQSVAHVFAARVPVRQFPTVWSDCSHPENSAKLEHLSPGPPRNRISSTNPRHWPQQRRLLVYVRSLFSGFQFGREAKLMTDPHQVRGWHFGGVPLHPKIDPQRP